MKRFPGESTLMALGPPMVAAVAGMPFAWRPPRPDAVPATLRMRPSRPTRCTQWPSAMYRSPRRSTATSVGLSCRVDGLAAGAREARRHAGVVEGIEVAEAVTGSGDGRDRA